MSTRPRIAAATGVWGVFCACSWTWCIGMYLPLLFLRGYGWPGVLVFAVPNVLGCAAFGYVLRNAEAARRLAQEHAGALRWFSIAAIAYHAWFATWLAGTVGAAAPASAAVGLCVVAAGAMLARLPERAWLPAAVAVYAVSLATFAAIGLEPLANLSARGDREPMSLMWLAPVIAAGFLLCPYLDATFHRALEHSPSRHAFAVFGLAFAPMIALTLAYRDRLEPLAWIPFAHIAAQSIFTVAAHGRELRERGGFTAPALILPGAAVVLALLTRGSAGEATYIRFLVLFGLVFPLYVLLFVGPGPVLPVSRRPLLAFAFAVGAALPFYELGFLGERTWLLMVPLAAFAAWKLLPRPTR